MRDKILALVKNINPARVAAISLADRLLDLFQDELEKATNEVHAVSYDDGYSDGHSEGYSEGHNSGCEDEAENYI